MTGLIPRLRSSQQDNLAAVCAIGADRLRAVADALDAAGFVIAKTRIEGVMNDAIGETDGSELASFVFGVTSGVRQNNSAPDETLRMLSEFVAADIGESQRYVSWESCKPELSRMLHSESVRLATKAIDVSYDFERIYMNGRFITSLRPVFDEQREKIMGGAIVQTLRLAYFSADGVETTLSLALDRADIVQLLESCERALRKGREVVRAAEDEWRLPTIMSGEDRPS